uniref:Uncharacterized protein n=1 Tax=Romanomermis culicivorax TaxID=13658 RepID=A0A915K4B8_ROMCU
MIDAPIPRKLVEDIQVIVVPLKNWWYLPWYRDIKARDNRARTLERQGIRAQTLEPKDIRAQENRAQGH